MNRLHWITGLSLLALLLGSCTSDREISQAPIPKPSVGQVAVKPQLPAPSASQTTKPTSGLTLPTRAIELPIPQGRPDPFGSVAVAPVKQPVPAATARSQPTTQQAREVGQTKQNQATPDRTSSAKTNSKQTGHTHQQSSAQPNVTAPKPQSLPEKPNTDRPLNVSPPPAPSTELASAVEVKGIMAVGGKVSAIVKTPNEPSRSVSAGDNLLGGAVRVKRIELGVDREPVVVLEQNGVEVVKAVSSNNSPIASL
ncbi:MAG TPA: hypothetical protein V6C85_10195 [Allocoleopsis sp.]